LTRIKDYFLQRFADRSGKKVTRISREAMQLLYAYPWPGNIRELEHAIERAVAMTSTAILYTEDFPAEIVNYRATETRPVEVVEGESLGTPQSLEQVERAHIVRVLREVNFK
jgi:DNA-binding NtrC family response regulator